MQTGFEVYNDFMNYKSGVYHHVTGDLAGGHAVKLIGWGVAEGETEGAEKVPYWICANSWGEGWGEQGYFKIKMGECGIDQSVWACTPEAATGQQESHQVMEIVNQ
jgi:cathepsin B